LFLGRALVLPINSAQEVQFWLHDLVEVGCSLLAALLALSDGLDLGLNFCQWWLTLQRRDGDIG
jgi:hypothetical protein